LSTKCTEISKFRIDVLGKCFTLLVDPEASSVTLHGQETEEDMLVSCLMDLSRESQFQVPDSTEASCHNVRGPKLIIVFCTFPPASSFAMQLK